MNELEAVDAGRHALARVLEPLAAASERRMKGESVDAIAAAIWDDFRSAVAAAVAELREVEAAGLQRWQQARHTTE